MKPIISFAIALAVVWFVCVAVLKVAGLAIHLVLLAAALLLITGIVRGAMSRGRASV
ncbi:MULTISPECIES: hypothetical protein [Myxococcaceae]|uniref:hypothetical protein n=1 Tax=Myxococcaceae TaxID=31 RepID=UPI00129C8FC1|nr:MULTISPECIES: hypothetical protein [Myxococcaceae]MBF5046493.1 hypothetical protein [Simulacricoccus sp. 17bor-14]